MAKCTYNPGINSSNPYAVLEVTQKSQDIEANTTTVSWTLKIYRPYSISSSVSKSYAVNVNGVRKEGTTTIGGSGTKTIASGTVDVAHDSDGEKTINFAFTLEFDITWSGSHIGTGSASGSMKLTTIPRATTPTLNPASVTIGESMTINLPRASSSFTHNLAYTFGDQSETIGTGIGASTTWTVPLSLISLIPNATSGKGSIRCRTLKGDTTIGITNVSFTAKVPSSAVPTISSVSIAEATEGIASKFGAYVQGYSKLSVNITAAGVYGSTISKYETTISGKTYSGKSIQSDVLTESGNITITVKVTDSRGRTATTTKTINVLAYSKPVITSFSAARATSSGVLDEDEGTYILASLNFSISTVGNKNDKTYKIEYKRSGTETWSAAISGSSYSLNSNLRSSSGVLNIDYEYQIRLTISDFFTSVSITVNVGSGFTLIDYFEDGRGLSFGRVAQRSGYIDSYLPIHAFSGITYDIPAVSAVDFNNFETSGIFYLFGVTSSQNYPVANNGWLEVMKYSTGSYIKQTFTTISGERYERIKYNGTWRAWNFIWGDSGWITPTLSSSFENSDTQPIQYRKIGKIVEVSGTCNPTKTLTSSTSLITMFTLPVGYRPSKRVIAMCKGSGVDSWMLMIETDGVVSFSRYVRGDAYVNPATASLLVSASFFTD